MELKDTIFILGAGASKPYGYPTAEELRDQLIDNYEDIISSTIEDFPNLRNKESEIIRASKDLLDKFNLSHTNSIDLFITRNENKLLRNTGIGLIWLTILWYELHSTLRAEDRNEDWYFDFFNQLTSDILKKDELSKLIDNKIHFITFNYDRSLENFLFLSFKNSYSLSLDETKNIISQIFEFHHVYGKVVPLDWESDRMSLPYKKKPIEGLQDIIDQSINIVYDERKADDPIQKIIHNSNIIFFLGFGFAKANIEFLNFKEILTKDHIIHATGLDLNNKRITQIKNQLMRGNVGMREHDIHFYKGTKCLQLLRDQLF